MKYVYKPNHPPAFASLPKGWEYIKSPQEIAKRLDVPESNCLFGLIGYNRELSAEELKHYELEFMGIK